MEDRGREYVYTAPDYDQPGDHWDTKLDRHRARAAICGIVQYWRDKVFGK
jgi:hypothetical protein